MKISFVIPAYNEERNIHDCIESIKKEIARIPGDYEIIVVNNASTDKTREIASKEKMVDVIDEEHKGIVWARKAGFEKSTGDLIANIDADNRLPEGWLSTVKDFFFSHNSLLALSGPINYYDSSLAIRYMASLFYRFGFAFDQLMKLIGKSSMLQGGNYVVRREAIEQIGGYDTNILFYGEDVILGKQISRIGKIIWTFKLPIYSSGRRLQKEGIWVTAFKYSINYLWIAFTGKPFNKKYIDVRL